MKKLFYIAMLGVLVALAGCGSTKTTVKAETEVSALTMMKADSTKNVVSETKTFGDTLRANNFVPAQVLTDTPGTGAADTSSYSITSSSDGIAFKETFTPTYAKGHFIGDQAAITAIAKPVTTTDTHEVQHSNVSTTTTKDSTAHVQTSVKKTIGWSVPWWVWVVAGLILVGVVIYFVKPLLKFI